MDFEITNNTRDFTLSPAQHDLIAERAGHLDPLLESFADDAVHLRVIVDDEAGRGNAIEVKLRLALPQRLLTTHEAGAFEPALNKAFKDLRRQLLDHKDHLRRDYEYKRKGGSASAP